MSFKLKKSSDQLFHKIKESKLNEGNATSEPILKTGTPSKAPDSAAKGLGPITTGIGTYLAGKLAKNVVGKAKEVYSDYSSGKSARKKSEADAKVKKADPYAAAKKNDANLDSYIKTRNSSKKGSQEYTDAQNKINAAYGNKKRHTASKVESKPVETKPVETKPADKVEAAKVNVQKAKVDAKKSVGTARANKLTAKSEAAKAGGNTRKADRLARRAKRVQGRADRGGSKVGAAIKGIVKKEPAAAKMKKKY